jgi:hypothetical protein
MTPAELCALLDNAPALRLRPGERVIFWTTRSVSHEQLVAFTNFMRSHGIPALLIGGVDGALVQSQDDGK